MQEWKPQMPFVEQFPVAMAYVPWQSEGCKPCMDSERQKLLQ